MTIGESEFGGVAGTVQPDPHVPTPSEEAYLLRQVGGEAGSGMDEEGLGPQ
jgi:hypothetical protein